MYEKIAHIMRRDYNAVDISGDDVEQYLREGSSPFVSADEEEQIRVVLDRLL